MATKPEGNIANFRFLRAMGLKDDFCPSTTLWEILTLTLTVVLTVTSRVDNMMFQNQNTCYMKDLNSSQLIVLQETLICDSYQIRYL